MKVLFDLNVVLDVLLDRAEHAEASSRAIDLAARGECHGLICAASIATLWYLLHASGVPRRRSVDLVRDLRRVLDVAPVDAKVIDVAISLGWKDMEDAIVDQAAQAAGATVIVTRDRIGFRQSALQVQDPGSFIALMKSGELPS